MSQNIRNLAIDLVMNQEFEVKGIKVPANLATPEKFGFPKGLSEEEYFQLLVKRDTTFKRFLEPKRKEIPDIDKDI